MDGAMLLAICGFAVVCACVAVKIAAGKGRNPVIWGAVGLLLNLPGLLVVTVLPQSQSSTSVLPQPAPAPQIRAAV